VGKDEVLAAGFTDNPRIALVEVVGDIAADLFPHSLEDAGAAGKVDAGESRGCSRQVSPTSLHRTGDKIDDAIGQSGFLQQLHEVDREHKQRRKRVSTPRCSP
jgi:hypothetical protein